YCGTRARPVATGRMLPLGLLLSDFGSSTGRITGLLLRNGLAGRASAHLNQAGQIVVKPLLEDRVVILRIHEPRLGDCKTGREKPGSCRHPRRTGINTFDA